MNYYKKTEELLYSYKTLIAEIKNLQIEISEIEYIGCGAMSYEERIQSSNAFNSAVENEILHREKEIGRLKDIIFTKENDVKKIDNALEVLDERSREIIKLKFFDNVSSKVIAIRVDVTTEWLCTLKNNAVNKMSNLILHIS